jgi:hypothetical protein
MTHEQIAELWRSAPTVWTPTGTERWEQGFEETYQAVPGSPFWEGYISACDGEIGLLNHPTDASKGLLIRRHPISDSNGKDEIREYPRGEVAPRTPRGA